MNKTSEYKNDIDIDPDALDIEWMNQSNLFYKYSAKAVKLTKAVADQEENVKRIRSDIILEIIESGEKATGPVIEATYRTDKRHKQAKEKLIELEYERDMAEIDVNAINYHKKPGLENLVKLVIAGYNAMPKVPRALGEELKKQQTDAVEEKMKKQKGKRKR